MGARGRVKIHVNEDLQTSQTVEGRLITPTLDSIPSFQDINFDLGLRFSSEASKASRSRQSVVDLLKQSWPTFERGKMISWNELLPPKKAY